MAEKDPDGPSLELPKFGLGRRRRGSKIEPEAADQPTEIFETERAELPSEQRVEQRAEQWAETAAPSDQRPLFADEAPGHDRPPTPADPTAAGGGHEGDESPRKPVLHRIGGIPASLLTGLVVGVLTVGLTGAGFRLCEVVQGTPSCGKPGILLLLAILITMIYVGKWLLMAFGLPDPGSTSFLAVGLLAVMALLFLVDVLFDWWMIIVIPIIAMITYALSHWVSTAFVEPADD